MSEQSADQQLDRVLREHFEAEMPRNWPAPPFVTEANRSSAGIRSARWVLVASVLAAVIAAKLLSGRFTSPVTTTTNATLESGSAKTPKEMRPNSGKSR